MTYLEMAETVKKEVQTYRKKPLKIQYGKSAWSGRARPAGFGNSLQYFDWVRVPEPKSDISLWTYFHELGHIYHDKQKLTCMWEYLADEFAIKQFKRFGIKISRKINNHHNWYMAYSLGQALNRGLKIVPDEMKQFKKYLKVGYMVGMKNGKKFTKKYYRAIIN